MDGCNFPHRNIIRNNFVHLCNEIDSTTLALMLYEVRILSESQLDLIFDRLGRRERNIIILLILLRKNGESFQKFKDSLTLMGRQDLYKLLNQ